MKQSLIVALVLVFVSACGLPADNIAAATPVASAEPTREIVVVYPSGTPAPTPTPVVIPPTPEHQDLYYVVQAGDTLTSIAREYGLTVDYIAGLNGIPDINTIYEGQVLVLTRVVKVPEPTKIDGKQIIVKLSVQKVYVYENGQLLKTFVVSTGITQYPTRVGAYQIWIKLVETRMTGPGYDFPHVPWVMYFDQGRGFHGKDWNDIYGRPSSHGCVNMTVDDAKWLFDWGEVGTDVLVIP